MEVSVALPAWNEAGEIEIFVVHPVAEISKHTGSFEIVVIDGSSRDASLTCIARLQ